MAFDMEAFIGMVENYPFLYDKSKKKFKDVSFKHTYWTAIGTAFNISAEEAIKKWKNLKDRYTKLKNNINKSKRSGAATSEIYKTNWKYFDLLDNMLKGGLRNEHLKTSNVPRMRCGLNNEQAPGGMLEEKTGHSGEGLENKWTTSEEEQS
ncbi:uncharacterized protein LOC111638948 [Centruroides sculpturatus]|uniref:uncharacterized protein LOC111638948 n=1 Tax=Centruroides sculpturatus TaxID=218467 RepID=UPI000C6CD2EF|nr:uncharacterized protein LOC111638948 [Centruroides sculpturatus]